MAERNYVFEDVFGLVVPAASAPRQQAGPVACSSVTVALDLNPDELVHAGVVPLELQVKWCEVNVNQLLSHLTFRPSSTDLRVPRLSVGPKAGDGNEGDAGRNRRQKLYPDKEPDLLRIWTPSYLIACHPRDLAFITFGGHVND